MGRKITDDDLKLLLNQGLSQAEIARKVGVSEQAVSWRVKRLRAKKESQDRDLSTILDDSNYQRNTFLKNQLNEKELKFIENYLVGGMTIEKAMIAAGYVGYHQKSLYRTGRKIVERFEHQGGDHRNLFRAVGLGEVRVIKGILELCNSKNLRAKATGLQLASKCLGLQKEVIGGMQAVTVIIQACRDQGQPSKPILSAPPALPGPQPYNHPQPSAPGQPIQITE